MKVVRYIVIVLLAVVSVAVGVWTLATGMAAPESKKITANSPLVQNVATTAEGIEELGEIFATQVEVPSDVDELAINEAKVEEYTNMLNAQQEAYNKALEDKAKLGELKSLNKKQREELKAADAVITEYKTTEANLNTCKENVEINKGNIAAYEKAKGEAVAEGENIVSLGNAVNGTIIWCYVLAVLAIAIIAFSFVMGLVQDPRKLISVGILLVIVAAVVGISYFVAAGEDANGVSWHNGGTLKDAAGYDLGIGTDPATRTVFGEFEYVISETSILVAYIVAGMAIVAAAFSVIRGLFK
ncbi:MAG: hypothetical protein J6C56_03255 [Alistipes sp.]|nr:hypothetical protein [Alistipes sp.]